MLKTIAQDSRQSWKTLGIIYCILPLVKTSNCYRKDGASIEAKLLLPLMCWPIHHLVHGCTGILGSLDYGIYPKLTRLLKGMKEPVSQKTNIFTNWQEAVRKDIERALGVLQAKFQMHLRPMLISKELDRIAIKVGSCLVLPNMCVSDRVMDGNPRGTLQPHAQLHDHRISWLPCSPRQFLACQFRPLQI
jgi:hypothetical protein